MLQFTCHWCTEGPKSNDIETLSSPQLLCQSRNRYDNLDHCVHRVYHICRDLYKSSWLTTLCSIRLKSTAIVQPLSSRLRVAVSTQPMDNRRCPALCCKTLFCLAMGLASAAPFTGEGLFTRKGPILTTDLTWHRSCANRKFGGLSFKEAETD